MLEDSSCACRGASEGRQDGDAGQHGAAHREGAIHEKSGTFPIRTVRVEDMTVGRSHETGVAQLCPLHR